MDIKEKIKNEITSWMDKEWDEDPNGFRLIHGIAEILEGEKMEDKTIKVRCISNGKGTFYLTKDKEYEAREYDKDRYIVKNDTGVHSYYLKELFEKVEDTLMVECIDNSGRITRLTLGEKYLVKSESTDSYLIKNDEGEVEVFRKDRFKPVEPQKEVKCYDEKCGNNKENKCALYCDEFSCMGRVAGPINYEEEYYKLKKAIEVKDKRIEWLEEEKEKLESDKRLREAIKKNNELKKTISAYYDEVTEKSKIIDVKEIANSKLRKENQEYKTENEKLKEIIKNITELL
jgi:hypothetical protein